MRGLSATPAAQHLFYNSEDVTKLSWTDADPFHHFVAQPLYLSKQARPDIQLAVSLLLTIVRDPDNYYYKKLSRVMKYTQGTIVLPLILSIYKSVNIQWYVDAAFAVHRDKKSHTIDFITMVMVGAYVQPIKIKIWH